MTELGDPAQLIIIARGSRLFPPLPWLVPPSWSPAESVKPRRAASEWAGKDGYLWSYHAGEINTKHRIFTALSGVSCVFKCVA